MYSIHVIILAAIFFYGIDANLLRRLRRQQASGSLYGSSNNPSAGYNYPGNTNLYGTNLNNQASKDLYGNPMGPANPGNSLNMGLPNQQQHQQQQQQQQLPQPNQQIYGAGGVNPSFTGTGPYTPNNMNPVGGSMQMRDNNGNIIPGSPGSSFYSPTNSQLGYPGNVNPSLTNKDAYNPASNINPNQQFGLNNNNNNNNNNPYPNSNTYVGQQIPNANNLWPNANNNNNNQYHSNTGGNSWGQNRDLNANNNNNNNAYSNQNSPYFYNNSGHQMMTSCFVLIFSLLLRIYVHI